MKPPGNVLRNGCGYVAQMPAVPCAPSTCRTPPSNAPSASCYVMNTTDATNAQKLDVMTVGPEGRSHSRGRLFESGTT